MNQFGNMARVSVTILAVLSLLFCSVSPFLLDPDDDSENHTLFAPEDVSLALSKALTWLSSLPCAPTDTAADRHRNIIAMALGDEHFFGSCNLSNLAFIKDLNLELILRLKTYPEALTSGQLALYILAQVASCNNPRDFYGVNLIARMTEEREKNSNSNNRNRFSEALEVLAYCSVGYNDDSLAEQVIGNIIDLDNGLNHISDSLSMNLLAANCIYGGIPENSSISSAVEKGLGSLRSSQRDDGSFGNIYTSALAIQALTAYSNQDETWEEEKSLNYVVGQQKEDGSFGDLLATYFAVPTLRRTSLAALKNYKCAGSTETSSTDVTAEQSDVPVISVWYSVWFNDNATERISATVSVKDGVALFDVMTEAARLDDRFKFEYKNSSFGPYITSIFGVEQDPANNMYWMVYEIDYDTGLPQQTESGVGSLKVKNNGHYVIWYKKVNFK